MMRALYNYYTFLGSISITVGTLITVTPGGSVQHTAGSGVYYPVSSVFLCAGSHNGNTLVLLSVISVVTTHSQI